METTQDMGRFQLSINTYATMELQNRSLLDRLERLHRAQNPRAGAVAYHRSGRLIEIESPKVIFFYLNVHQLYRMRTVSRAVDQELLIFIYLKNGTLFT
jgi:hypothetical protein